MATTKKKATNLNEPSIEAKGAKIIEKDGRKYQKYSIIRPDYEPFTVECTIKGTSPALFHAFDVTEYRRKEQAKKGSREKKTDNIQSYVYRNKAGELCWPGLNFKAALVNASKRFQDPGRPRATAHDLMRAGIVVDPYLAPITMDGKKLTGDEPWNEYGGVDSRGVVVNQSKIIRDRPFLNEGWECSFNIMVNDSELISPEFLYEIVQRSCNFSGLGDYRPDFGRYSIQKFDVLKEILPQAQAA